MDEIDMGKDSGDHPLNAPHTEPAAEHVQTEIIQKQPV
jgi:hypothetical protein